MYRLQTQHPLQWIATTVKFKMPSCLVMHLGIPSGVSWSVAAKQPRCLPLPSEEKLHFHPSQLSPRQKSSSLLIRPRVHSNTVRDDGDVTRMQ